MPETSPSQPRSVLAVLGVLALVAGLVAGAVLLSQRQDDVATSSVPTESTSPADDGSVAEAPTPASGQDYGDLSDLPTIDPSDFPTEPDVGLPTEFPTDIFPAEFPTDDAGWEAWASEQMAQQ